MPARFSPATAVCAFVVAGCTWAPQAWSQAPAGATLTPESEASEPTFQNSTLDASLFYQLLVGELELSASEGSTASMYCRNERDGPTMSTPELRRRSRWEYSR